MNKLEIKNGFPDIYKQARCKDLINAINFFLDKGTYSGYQADHTEIKILKYIRRLLRCNKYNLLIATPDKLDEIRIVINKFSSKMQIKDGCPNLINNKCPKGCKQNCKSNFLKFIVSNIFDYEKFKDDESWIWTIDGTKKISRKTKKNDDGAIEKVCGRFDYLDNIIGIGCCPYCNRAYIMKQDIKIKPDPTKKSNYKTINPALDHYFSKSKYPYFALSLYNLIPCCDLCNSKIKSTSELKLKYHIHPYKHSFHKKIKFVVVPDNLKAFNDSPDDFSIEIQEKQYENSKKAKEYADFFGLEDLYNNHKDYAAEILVKKQIYNKAWLDGVNSAEGLNLNLTLDDAKRYYYGNYLKEGDINKRPLSKLTIDLLDGEF